MSRFARLLGMIIASALAVGIMVLWIRAYSVSARDLKILAGMLQWWTLPPLLLLLAAHVGFAACRWSRIEVALGARRPEFSRAFGAGAVALGLGTFLPGLLTNVAARALSNRLGGTGAIRGALSGTMDQLADLAVVSLFLPAAIIGVATNNLAVYVVAVGASAAIGFAGLPLLAVVLRPFNRCLGDKPHLLADPGFLRPVYGLSLLRFSCLTLMTLLVHFATGAATVSASVIAIPLVTIAISLAMLPGGLGVSEWSFSAVFAAMNIGHQQIVLFVLANRILLSGLGLLLMVLTLCHAAMRASREPQGLTGGALSAQRSS